MLKIAALGLILLAGGCASVSDTRHTPDLSQKASAQADGHVAIGKPIYAQSVAHPGPDPLAPVRTDLKINQPILQPVPAKPAGFVFKPGTYRVESGELYKDVLRRWASLAEIRPGDITDEALDVDWPIGAGALLEDVTFPAAMTTLNNGLAAATKRPKLFIITPDGTSDEARRPSLILRAE